MKRCTFALVLLGILLATSLWVTGYMDRTHGPISEAVNRAGNQAAQGQWEVALAEFTQAREDWESQRRIVAVFADHSPMEDVDALFAQLEVAGNFRDGPAFASLCAHLGEALDALGEAHSPSWWNVL